MPSYSTELNMFTRIYRRAHADTSVSLATFRCCSTDPARRLYCGMRGLSSMADCARVLNQIVRMSSSPQCPADFLPLYILAAKSCSGHSLEHRVGRVLCFFSRRRYWDSPTPYPLSRRRLWPPPPLYLFSLHITEPRDRIPPFPLMDCQN
jgi:hypothetical protein